MGGSLKTRAAAKAATKAELTATAARLFRAKGYDGVQLRDVAQICKRTTGSIYAHFAGKAALYEAAMGKPPPDVAGFLRELTGGGGFVAGGTAARARELLAQLQGVDA